MLSRSGAILLFLGAALCTGCATTRFTRRPQQDQIVVTGAIEGGVHKTWPLTQGLLQVIAPADDDLDSEEKTASPGPLAVGAAACALPFAGLADLVIGWRLGAVKQQVAVIFPMRILDPAGRPIEEAGMNRVDGTHDPDVRSDASGRLEMRVYGPQVATSSFSHTVKLWAQGPDGGPLAGISHYPVIRLICDKGVCGLDRTDGKPLEKFELTLGLPQSDGFLEDRGGWELR